MYNTNLILDHKHQIKIPQNSNTFFVINENTFFTNSLSIKIEPYEDVDIINLYLIIKSYCSNLIYIPSKLFIIVKNPNQKEFLAWNSSVSEFKNITYYGFIDWFYNQLHKDWEYIHKDGEYFFVFTYPIKVFDINLLSTIKPKYPWKSELLEKFTKLKHNEEYYIMTIEAQKIEINKLKELLKNR